MRKLNASTHREHRKRTSCGRVFGFRVLETRVRSVPEIGPALNRCVRYMAALGAVALCVFASATSQATPANRLSLQRYLGSMLARRIDNCAACHQTAAPAGQVVELKAFPHNAFGSRLKALGDELRAAGKPVDIPVRMAMAAREDSDGDGIDNLAELLLGHQPGNRADVPTKKELLDAPRLKADFARLAAAYRWRPFERVQKPRVPAVKQRTWPRTPIDNFIAAEHESRGLVPRPEAPKQVLLRRVHMDIIGLAPTPEEIRAFEEDKSPGAYGRVVDRLLASPRYGERWGRHWMDVWRYSDWAGWGDQVRDSKPHVWRWRDWIVESLNMDKGYDRMVQEMLAGDEIAPGDPDTVRATGFLVRNYKLLSREQWMEDVVGHTSKAFLGVTMHCAKCHDHMYDPITSDEYYRLRAIFEPHNVRTVRVPGQRDINKDGLVHAYDAELKALTYYFPRGDERNPDKTKPMEPGVPACFGGKLDIRPVSLPVNAARPERREFEINEAIALNRQAVDAARKSLADSDKDDTHALNRPVLTAAYHGAEARLEALMAILEAERQEDAGQKGSAGWKSWAEKAVFAQRRAAVADADQNRLTLELQVKELEGKVAAATGAAKSKPQADLEASKKKLVEAAKAYETAKQEAAGAPSVAYKPRIETSYPAESTGRRLAFANWLTDAKNPLTARVAANHIWLRHFGTGLTPSASDFGRNSKEATNPRLLDWMAAWLMENGWKMKSLHRMIVMSAVYRQDSRPDPVMARLDQDNTYFWRMNSRRLEAEAVRDNVLWVSGGLDQSMGGPEIDHKMGLASKRRSIYLRQAAEKQVEFLQIFDGPSVTECYERKQTVMPQQALALANSELAIERAVELAKTLDQQAGPDTGKFIGEAYLRILCRPPTVRERKLCQEFLASAKQGIQLASSSSNVPVGTARGRQNLVLVLLNHHEFVTVR